MLQHVRVAAGEHKNTHGVIEGIWTDPRKRKKVYVRLRANRVVELFACEVAELKTPHADLFFGPPVPITWVDRLFISQKVCDKFLRRAMMPTNPERIAKTIRKIIHGAREVKLRPRFRPIALMNHRLEEARYYFSSGWLVVIAGEKVRTIYRMRNQHRFEM